MSNYYGILLICTIGNEKEDFNKLELALEDIFIKYFARNINKDNKNYKEQNNSSKIYNIHTII